MGPGGGGRLGLALGPRCLWAAAMGWAPPRLAAGARYGLWAATRRGAAAPRGARGLRGSNPFTRGQEEEWRRRNRTALTYIAAAAVGMVGMSYAAVPLYRLYCQVPGGPRPPPSPLGERAAGLSAAFAFAQATGLGGTTGAGRGAARIEEMEAVKERVVKVTFNADVHSSLQWNFRPQQSEIYVVPGETALAFYKAKNPTDKPIIGISTYNVVPFEAGQYFNKIQCFCFEEQRLNPQEEVDMPVFFYIDPEFAEDPKMAKVDLITLSYTFFEAKEGQHLPLPGYQ
uniref:Cytochrome c oxidase assembly protein COX11, mitochondrial n=3 Tax=Anatinae TaxID=2068716 RepID=A0A493TPM2_ANAPP